MRSVVTRKPGANMRPTAGSSPGGAYVTGALTERREPLPQENALRNKRQRVGEQRQRQLSIPWVSHPFAFKHVFNRPLFIESGMAAARHPDDRLALGSAVRWVSWLMLGV